MRCWTASLTASLLALAAGCAQPPLTRSDEVQALLKENQRLTALVAAHEQKIAQLTPAGTKMPEAAPARPEDPFRAVAVRFGKFTDVVGRGGKPADERLKVVVEPLDAEGDVVKRAGSLDLEAFEAGAATPKPIVSWKIPADVLAKTWLNGLGTYAYVLKLPWPEGRAPQEGKLLLKMRFTTLSGEVLTAETTISVDRAAKTAETPAAKPKG